MGQGFGVIAEGSGATQDLVAVLLAVGNDIRELPHFR